MVENISATLISTLRDEVLKYGCSGIKGLGLAFKKMDIDYSKRIVYEELRLGLSMFGIRMSEGYLRTLFKALDTDRSGGIDFLEFMRALRPPMSDIRIGVINEAYNKLDVNNDGVLNIDDLKVIYAANARQHPKYLSGEWTEEETLRSFLDSIDTPGCPDGKVTREEFLNYYSGVSSTIDDDMYFDMMMRNCYGLPPRGSSAQQQHSHD